MIHIFTVVDGAFFFPFRKQITAVLVTQLLLKSTLQFPAQLINTGQIISARLSAVKKTNTGSAEYFSGLQGAARLLTRRGDYAEALKVLNLVEPEKLGGRWRGALLLSRGQTLEAAGRNADAQKAYRDVLADGLALSVHKRAAQEAINRLEKQ